MNEIPNISSSGIPKINIDTHNIIERIELPIVQKNPDSVIRGLELPIFDVPNTTINYPVINVPTQEEFDSAVKAEKEKQQQEEKQKERTLPNTTPPPPQLPAVVQTPPTKTPIAEIPADKPTNPTLTVFGTNINLPDPSIVATAGAVAVVTTASTMVATQVLNVVKNAAEPIIREATKNKFKIKIKQVKPVLHYVMAEAGHIDIFEYSAEGTRLVAQTDNVEQYIRDQVDTNAYYEMDNKVIIDDVMADKFTKERQRKI